MTSFVAVLPNKGSFQTLGSNYTSTTEAKKSIKSIAKSVAISIADSGIHLSRSGSLRLKHQNTNSNSILAPADSNQEIDRLVTQHYILRTAFDADFSAPIQSLCHRSNAPNSTKEKRVIVLDVGCGSGTWTMEMATQFPHATFIGIDKILIFPQHIKPTNCRFKLVDIFSSKSARSSTSTDDTMATVKLPFPDQSVDYIFQRDLNWDLSEDDWAPMVQEYYRILKPGGWLEIVEPDVEAHSTSAYEDYFISKLIHTFYQRHQDPFIAKRLSSFMAFAGFRRIQSDFQSIPLGWGFQKLFYHREQQQQSRSIVIRNLEDLRCSEFARAAAGHRLELLESLKDWFCRENNISASKYEAFVSQLPNEWYHTKAYTNWHRSVAQKPYQVIS